ncbi:MAG: septal ring lytic transglycosylase RlpA family protein [Casimicrobiaceae bacterium]
MMRWHRIGLVLIAATVLVGCAGSARKPARPLDPAQTRSSGSGGYYSTDGPPEQLPADLDRIPDAVPREEPLHRFANRPYTVFGVSYTPMTRLVPMSERGMASWYGRKFHGQRTAIGEVYDMFAMTAAHPTAPLPSYARVTHLRNGRSVIVRLNDRGPFLHGRIIDLSYAAAHRLGIAQAGSGEVLVELLAPPFDGASLALSAGPTSVPPPPPAPAATSSLDTVVPYSSLPPSEPFGQAASASASADRFVVQLGAFGNFANARAFQARMQASLNAAVQMRQRDGLFRVQLGPFPTRAEAARAQREAEAVLGTSLILIELRP